MVLCGNFSLSAITTNELPQEGRVETVNCLMDEVCVCICVRVCRNKRICVIE